MRDPDSDREAIRALRAALVQQIASNLDMFDRVDAITARHANR
ncbi:hypothetical protein JHFBIEKO_3548 [Methylobacterium mesophilicum]|nr:MULTISPECIES: hypothetical protein [Methylobacterium]GJE23087.1 hypothetical protein JHFBIEKO_3548 [Methylobacterium mesophilicum]